MATLRQFANRIRRIGRRVERNGPAIARQVAILVDQAVVTSTPVDTGRARSNWQAHLGAPVSGTVDALFPGRGGSTGEQNTAASLAAARAVISGFRGESSIHITNNLEYIEDLNRGSSAQAPAQFVESAVLTGVNAARNSRILSE